MFRKGITPVKVATSATLNEIFACAQTGWASQTIHVSEGGELSFAQLCAKIETVSNRLRDAGLKPGDRVAIVSFDPLDCLTVFWGTTLIGGIFVPLDPAAGRTTLEYIIEHAAPRFFFTDNREKDRITSLKNPAGKVEIVAFDVFRPQQTAKRDKGDASPPAPETPAAILYTSGSTGRPKGVLHSHGALCRSGQAMASHYCWSSDDRFLNLAPPHTMSGLRNSAIVPFIAGCQLQRPEREAFGFFFKVIESVKRNRITLLGCAPIFVKQLSLFKDRIDRVDLESLRAILCTGSMLPLSIVKDIHKHFALPVVNYYGLTETAGFCAGYSLEKYLGQEGGIGFPVESDMEIRNETGEVRPGETAGELVIRSDNLMLGYYRDQELTAAVLRDGAFFTGDIVEIAADGEVILIGRKKNFIKNAHTEMICFEEVELTLEQHPQVLEAATCGAMSRLDEEELAAFVVTREPVPSQDDFTANLKTWLLEQLGPHKVPQRIRIVSELPRISAGKLDRQKIERMFNDC